MGIILEIIEKYFSHGDVVHRIKRDLDSVLRRPTTLCG